MESLSRTIHLGAESLNIGKKSGVEEIALYNTAGRVVFRQEISPGTLTLDLSSYRLGSGSYILRVKIKGKYRIKRTVITK